MQKEAVWCQYYVVTPTQVRLHRHRSRCCTNYEDRFVLCRWRAEARRGADGLLRRSGRTSSWSERERHAARKGRRGLSPRRLPPRAGSAGDGARQNRPLRWLRPQRHHQHHQPRRGHSGPCAGLCVRGLPSLQSLARSERADEPLWTRWAKRLRARQGRRATSPATAPATTLTPGCTKRWATASPTWPTGTDLYRSEF